MLVAIKVLHTIVWAMLAAGIIALPIVAVRGRFRWGVFLTAIICAECAVLACNAGRCPLTDIAAHFTADRRANFDIYLPLWLARYNKQIFGTLFLAGEAVFAVCWLRGVMNPKRS